MTDLLTLIAAIDWSPAIRTARALFVLCAAPLAWMLLPSICRAFIKRDAIDADHVLACLGLLILPTIAVHMLTLADVIPRRTDPWTALVVWAQALAVMLGLVWSGSLRRINRRARTADIIDQADCAAMARLRACDPVAYEGLQIELRALLKQAGCE